MAVETATTVPGGVGAEDGGVGGSESTSCAMRFRIASFGSRPVPAPMFSTMCAGLVVPVRTTVMAGWLRAYLMKNCAHVLASNSAAHSGRGVLLARWKMRPRSKGKYAIAA